MMGVGILVVAWMMYLRGIGLVVGGSGEGVKGGSGVV